MGLPKGEPEGWGGRRVGGPKIRFFSLFRHNFHSFFPLSGVFLWIFGGVFEFRDPKMFTFGLSGLSSETPPALDYNYNWNCNTIIIAIETLIIISIVIIPN